MSTRRARAEPQPWTPGSSVRRLLAAALLLVGALLLPGCSPVPQPSPSPAPVPASPPPRTPVLVTAFGATGDGRHDDRPALQAALDQAARTGADVVLPAGRFLIASATAPGDRLLRTYPDQHLRGSGASSTVLVVGSVVGPYVTVLGAATDSTGTGDWSMTGLSVDQGASRGQRLEAARMAEVPRMVVRLGDYRPGSRVSVLDCGFTDSDNVNTLYLFGQTLTVQGNRFTRVGGPVGTPVHDHSTLYLTSTVANGTQRVVDNVFAGVRSSGGATTAIETHGGRQDITGNVVTDYLRGLNLTGVASVPATAVVVAGNRLEGVGIGMELWADRVPGRTGPTGLQDVTVRGNAIVLDGAVWARLPGLRAPTSAVLVHPTNVATISRLSVVDDDIWFRALPSPPVEAQDTAAVACRTSGTATPVGTLVVSGNHSDGAPVWLNAACPVRPGLVRQNDVR